MFKFVVIWLLIAGNVWAITVNDAQNSFGKESIKAKVKDAKELKGGESHLILGILYHNLASEGAIEYIAQSKSELKKYLEKNEKSAIAKGYLGSLITIDAGVDSKKGDLFGATGKLKEGAEFIDGAVKLQPKDISIRFLRIYNAIEVTKASPFSRMGVIDEDVKFLDAESATMNKSDKGNLYFAKGKMFLLKKNIAKAVEMFELSLKTDPASKHATEAKKLISEYEE